jgi:hypothetical protein
LALGGLPPNRESSFGARNSNVAVERRLPSMPSSASETLPSSEKPPMLGRLRLASKSNSGADLPVGAGPSGSRLGRVVIGPLTFLRLRSIACGDGVILKSPQRMVARDEMTRLSEGKTTTDAFPSGSISTPLRETLSVV